MNGCKTIVSLLVLLLGGCATPLPKREMLPAAGLLITDAPVVRSVAPDSPAEGAVFPGDRVVALDGVPVASIQDGLKLLNDKRPTTVTVERAGLNIVQLPFDLFADEDNRWGVFFLSDEEVFTVETQSPSGLSARAGIVYAGKLAGSIVLSRWDADPRLLEVEVEISVPTDCTDCELRDIYVMDWERRAWLSPVPMRTAAYALLPDLGAPGVPVAVPPPTVVGQNSYTTMSGTLSANTYGGRTTGHFTGSAYTTTTPVYDYSAQMAATGYNLGVAIRNARIEKTNKARYEFVSRRFGTLRTGKLNRGQQLTGHIFFAAPHGFDGPYVVFVDAGENERGAAKFGR